MEHRIGERHKVALPVSLSQNGRFLGGFTTRDVCPGGISLYGYVANLANNRIVNVALQSPQGDGSGTQNFKAFVVHQEDGCLGLMWVEKSADINALLAGHACIPPRSRGNASLITFPCMENP